ncbi:MAG: hypothetical protein MJY43_03465 [Bacteroidales bacterium]|nr:hypothetical protein [Bacteroidales bacterium]
MVKRLSVLILSLSLAGISSFGQNNPAAIEMDKAGALWFNSGNAAGMAVASIAPFEAVDANWHLADGDYRSYTEGNASNLTVNAEGATSLWKGKVWGKFSYSNITERDTKYNTLFLNLDEDNPFFVADANLSWWKKQKYEIALKASTPFYWDRLAFGIDASYFTESGAKQIDPRGYGSEYALSVKPGAVLEFGKHHIGLNLDYENGNMRMTPINNAYMNSWDAFILHGLGNSEKSFISLLTTGIGQVYDKKNQFGANLQYGYQGEGFRMLADVHATIRNWDFSHTPSRPEAIGSTARTDLGADISIVKENDRFFHKISVNGSMKSTDGIEYVQVFNKDYNVQAYEIVAQNIKSKYSHTEGRLYYDLVRKSRDSYSWLVGAEVDYYSRNDRYVIPVSTFDCANIFAGVHGKKQFFLKNLSISAGANAGYCKGLGGEYNYQGTSADTPVVTDYFPHELAYKTANWFCAGLDLRLSVRVLKTRTIYAGAKATMLKTDNPSMRGRTIADISLGFIF